MSVYLIVCLIMLFETGKRKGGYSMDTILTKEEALEKLEIQLKTKMKK